MDEVLGAGAHYAVQQRVLDDFEARHAIRPRTTTAIRPGTPGEAIVTEVHLRWDEFLAVISRVSG